MPKCVNIAVSSRKGKNLENEIQVYCDRQKKIVCKGLGRRSIFLEKYLECTRDRKDRNRRMQLFFCAIALLKSDMSFLTKTLDGKKCYEFAGTSSDGHDFGVHIREEYTGKDRKLYLISTFDA